ncbi:MAG: hypothetical protein A2583_01670 [Bdellovibrionales bacterium RIFOXYD1_FULL_53_11]|nr:MAG: hypothetical protein A2583_01670 [Bdellovibrionales bacterium RIFOXYD1_FULL_53_11]
MALKAVKQLYPELELHMVVRERFEAAAKKVHWLDGVFTLPTRQLIGPVLTGENTIRQSLGDAARWVSPLVEKPWDFVVNWSFSSASSYLAGLVPAFVKLGYSRRTDNTFACEDGWSQYMQAFVQDRVDQNIHVTDILTTQLLTALQIHLGEPENVGNNTVTSKAFFATDPPPREVFDSPFTKWIAIQLGASQKEKTWKAGSWARTASIIMNNHPECGIILLGGREERELETAFMNSLEADFAGNGRVRSFVGATDFDKWASIIGSCQWLFSADTAAVHLASVLGTRVLNVSVGPVKLAETGPYGNGHYVVSSAHEDVTPEAVYAAWSYGSGEWSHNLRVPFEKHAEGLGIGKDVLSNARVQRSKIRPSEEGGGVVYEPMIKRELRVGEWIGMAMGHIARTWYCGWTPAVGSEITRDLVSRTLVQSLRQAEKQLAVLSRLLVEGHLMASSISRKSMSLHSQKIMDVRDRMEIQELGAKLAELDQHIDAATASHVVLEPIGKMSKVLMHNLHGNSLVEISRASAAAYQQLNHGAGILRDWIKHTLSLARPVAVMDANVVSLASRRAGKESTT